jgi:hypothetical protein
MTQTPTAETARLERLTTEDEALHGYVHMDETDDGHYYLVVREKPHPDAEGQRILSERYAYLTKNPSEGSDGWIDNGINRRDADPAELAADLAQMYAQMAARLRNGSTDRDAYSEDRTDD